MCRFPIEEIFYKTDRSAVRYYTSIPLARCALRFAVEIKTNSPQAELMSHRALGNQQETDEEEQEMTHDKIPGASADLSALSDLCTPWCIRVVATLRIAD